MGVVIGILILQYFIGSVVASVTLFFVLRHIFDRAPVYTDILGAVFASGGIILVLSLIAAVAGYLGTVSIIVLGIASFFLQSYFVNNRAREANGMEMGFGTVLMSQFLLFLFFGAVQLLIMLLQS